MADDAMAEEKLLQTLTNSRHKGRTKIFTLYVTLEKMTNEK